MGVRRFFGRLFAAFGMLIFLLIIAGGAAIYFLRPSAGPAVPAKTILQLDLEQEFSEQEPDEGFADILSEPKPTLLGTIQTLQRAAEDNRVLGLVARVGAQEMGLATIQELRNAVLAFRNKGKPAIAYAETFGEFSPGNGAYYLATAFNPIYLQPSGDLGLVGLTSKSPFVRGTLDKLGILPRLDHRGKYKTAMNTFTETGYTEAQREADLALITSQFGQITRGIAETRGMAQAEVSGLINKGPFLSAEALAMGFVDGLAYRDEVFDATREKIDPQAQFLTLSQYRSRTAKSEEDKKAATIALIYGVGAVMRGESEGSPLAAVTAIGSDTLAKAFRDAAKDSDVKAILFRIDSPGGSYVASDIIWRETQLARKAGKPLIVSMGDVAGSGGYFIAMAADKILAQPGTITGSIGVFAGKPVLTDFWSKLGITWSEVHTSENSTFWSTNQDYTPEQWALFERWLDHVYTDFTTKTAEGRHLPIEKVQEIAQGRVWTGEDALERGLVDALGGFPEAIRQAKLAAGLPEEAPVQFKRFPAKRSLAETITEHFFKEDEGKMQAQREVAITIGALGKILGPMVRLAQELGLAQEPAPLTMPQHTR